MRVCLGLAFCVFLWFRLDYFVPVLFALVVLGLVSSVLITVGWIKMPLGEEVGLGPGHIA